MFTFNIPKWSMLVVNTPDGAVMPLVHLGSGHFASPMPPIRFQAMAPAVTDLVGELQDVSWDGGIFGEKIEGVPLQVLYDVKAAYAALEAAAEAGDAGAAATIARLKQLQALAEG